MNTTPYSQIPGINSLFLDYVEQPNKVREFYPSKTEFRKIEIPHRRELCRILERQNREWGNKNAASLIEKLEQENTGCIITGQQVGLFTGPLYAMWKALTAIHTSRQLQNDGVDNVPIFWMASEDHNWHEITNFGLLSSDFELIPFSLKQHLFLSRQPAGTIPVNHPEIRKILIRAFQHIKIPEIRQIYGEGTLAQAFARTLLWLMRDFPLLVVDPADPELKALGRPFFQRFFSRSTNMLQALAKQNEQLRQQHYPVQVSMEPDVLPLFSVENNERVHVPANGNSDSLSPEKLSPSALLRPLFQDFIFPTLAYVGGPAEIAYFAQLHPWYRMMEIEQPQLLPRVSLTLLPNAIQRFLDANRLQPIDLYQKEEILIDALISSDELRRIKTVIRDNREKNQQGFEEIKQNAERFDPTLRKAVETSERKVNYQLNKIERKSLLAARRKNHLLGEQILKAKNVIYPTDKLQERYINIFSFSSRLPELIGEVFEQIDWHINEHQWIPM